jgi:hypothetical protein
MKPMSDYARKKEWDRTYRHYLKTVDSVPDFINRKLVRMPNNKGYIWRGMHCYGALPPERGEPLVMFEKRGNTLVIYESTDSRHKVFNKVGSDRKVLVYDVPRRRTACGSTSIMDFCTNEHFDPEDSKDRSQDEGWVKPRGRSHGKGKGRGDQLDHDRSHGKGKGRGGQPDHDRSHGKGKGRGGQPDHDRSHGKGKGRGGQPDHDRSRGKGRGGQPDHDRSHGKGRGDQSVHDRSRGKGRVDRSTPHAYDRARGSQGRGSLPIGTEEGNSSQGPRNPKPSAGPVLKGVWANNTIL